MRETELVFQQASLCKSCLSLVRSPFLCRYLQNCYRDLGKTNKVLVTVYKLYVLFNAPPTRIRTFWKPHILKTAFFKNRIRCPDPSLVSCELEADMRFQKYPDSKKNYCWLPHNYALKWIFTLLRTSVRTPLTPTQETLHFSLLRPLHRSTSDARHIFRQEPQKIGTTVTPIS